MKKCTVCGDCFLGEEISEWNADHEAYSVRPFICPDCYDRKLGHKDLEDQFKELMKEGLGMVKITISNGEDTMTEKADAVVAITMSSTPVSDKKERTNVNAMMVGEAAPKTVFPVLAFTLGQLARDIIEDKNKLAKVASQMHVQLMEGLTGGSSVLDLTDETEDDSDEDPEDIESTTGLNTGSRGWRTR